MKLNGFARGGTLTKCPLCEGKLFATFQVTHTVSALDVIRGPEGKAAWFEWFESHGGDEVDSSPSEFYCENNHYEGEMLEALNDAEKE